MIREAQDLDYLNILKAIHEIPFPVGKALLINVLRGITSNKSVMQHGLHKLLAMKPHCPLTELPCSQVQD